MSTPNLLKPSEAVPREFLPILRQSRVLADRSFEAVEARVHAGEYPPDSVALAGRLVDDAILTEYQARRLLRDRGQGLASDRYVILDRIGSGGMGTVYKARHKLMERTVALKLISEERMSSPRKVARFQREMRLISRLDHPNVVRAFDADRFCGIPCLVMEYVQGQDVEQRLRSRGPLSPAKAARYVAQAALGLAHAHDQGVIHRDIKPSNILVGEDGQIKVLDFGVGALMESWDDTEANVTAEGLAAGTFDYMSPEQATCRKLDGRSDLYSLGCTLYQMLSGRLPFPGDSKIERLAKRLNGPPVPITDVVPGLHPGLVIVLDRLMAPEPESRFPSAGDAAEALLALTVRKGDPPPAIPNGRHRSPAPPAVTPPGDPPATPVVAPTHSSEVRKPAARQVSGEDRVGSDAHPRTGPARERSPVSTLEPSPLASYRNGIEESGGTSGRKVEAYYLATVARMNESEISRLSRELEQARQSGGGSSGGDNELTGLLRELGMTLLDEHWPKLVLIAVLACVLGLGWSLSQALG